MTLNYAQISSAVYQACTTYDQYLPPLSADLARAWGKVFAHYQLSPEDLLAGVDKIYLEHGSGYRPLPADIADAARAIRQDRYERQPLEQVEAHNSHLAPLVTEFAEVATIPGGEPPWTIQRSGVGGPRSVPCPWCHVEVGQPCNNTATRQPLKAGHHDARLQAMLEARQTSAVNRGGSEEGKP